MKIQFSNSKLAKYLLFLLLKAQLVVPAMSQHLDVNLEIGGNEMIDDEERINIFVLSDGYIASDEQQFLDRAETLKTLLFGTSPFNFYGDYFNFYKIFVPSDHSGALHPCVGCNGNLEAGCTEFLVTTAFGSSYDTEDPDGNGFHRLLCADAGLVNDFIENGDLAQHIPSSNITYTTIVLVNTAPVPGLSDFDEWGGCGNIDDGIATMTSEAYTSSGPPVNSNFALGAIHEFGHTFALLQDEYFYDNNTEAPNKDEAVSPATPDIWDHWDGINNIDYHGHTGVSICGTLQDATGWYKPRDEACMMERVDRPFCSVCSEAIIERIHQLVNPIESFLPVDPITPTAPIPRCSRL
jgi:hypothetical protein